MQKARASELPLERWRSYAIRNYRYTKSFISKCYNGCMKTLNTYPPNYEKIITLLPIDESKNPIFCYGNAIHNPFGRHVTPDLEVHEGKHSEQQGSDPEHWWMKYLTDKDFRLEQELEAYAVQYLFALKYVKNRQLTEWLLGNMAKALAGPQYGDMLNVGEAEVQIKRYVKKEKKNDN